MIDPYNPLVKIGEGSIISAYTTKQEKPISRKIALKIIKWCMNTKNVIARSEFES